MCVEAREYADGVVGIVATCGVYLVGFGSLSCVRVVIIILV